MCVFNFVRRILIIICLFKNVTFSTENSAKMISNELCSAFITGDESWSVNDMIVYNRSRCKSDSTEICDIEFEYFNYDHELKICEQCFDAKLSKHIVDDHNQNWNYFLGYFRSAIDGRWGYGRFDSDIKDEATDSDVLAYMENETYRRIWNVSKSVFLPNVNYTVYVKKINGTQELIFIDADREYKRSCDDRLTPDDANSICITHTICTRKRRYHCTYKSFYPTACMFDSKYGCHKYAYVKYFKPDGEFETDRGFEIPRTTCGVDGQPKYWAMSCPKSECTTCNVTQWSNWSECSATVCGFNGTSTRTRSISNTPCENSYVYESYLKQRRHCSVERCDDLLANFNPFD